MLVQLALLVPKVHEALLEKWVLKVQLRTAHEALLVIRVRQVRGE
jgi:hypothetical protein